MSPTKELTKDALIQCYTDEKMSISQIAKKYHHSSSYIRFRFEEFEIPLHPKIWRKEDNNGYVVLYLNGKHFLEHRYIWEQANGKLPPGWIVTQLNGIKNDTRLTNLIGLPRKNQDKYLLLALRKRIGDLEKEIKGFKNDNT